MQVFLGIDWSDTHHDACFLEARGQVLSRVTVEHTAAGLAQLERALARVEARLAELQALHRRIVEFQATHDAFLVGTSKFGPFAPDRATRSVPTKLPLDSPPGVRV